NVYSVGSVKPGTDLDPGSATYTLGHTHHQLCYLSVLSSTGDFVGACRIADPANNARIGSQNVCVDKHGNIYCAAGADTSINWGAGPMPKVGGQSIVKFGTMFPELSGYGDPEWKNVNVFPNP